MSQSTEISLWVFSRDRFTCEFSVRGWLSDKDLGSMSQKALDRPKYNCAPSYHNELSGRARLGAELEQIHRGSQQEHNAVLRELPDLQHPHSLLV